MIEDKEQNINLKEEVLKYLQHWRWFLLSIFIALILAFLYIKFTPKSYSVATKILIKDEKSNDLANQLSAFSDLGIGSGKNNIENEIEILKSRTLVYNTLDSLNLFTQYINNTDIISKELYSNSPISLWMENENISEKIELKLTSITSDSFDLFLNDDKIGKHYFNKIIKTKIGNITLNKKNDVNNLNEIFITVNPKIEYAEAFQKKININPSSKTSSIVEISMIDETPEKAADFLNTLVRNYNLNGVKDK